MPVHTKDKWIEDQEDNLDLVSALWGGTQAMRDADKLYLPREEAEETLDYKRRKEMSFLTNFFKKSVKVMAGRLFEDKVTIADSDSLRDLFRNIHAH